MQIVKRIAGLAFTLMAVALFVVGFMADGSAGNSQSVLDSPEASGRLLGTMIPVVLFGVIGVWLLFSKRQAT
jgi:succinate dehydrogenase/fumarate reductase cytochrome b subunit